MSKDVILGECPTCGKHRWHNYEVAKDKLNGDEKEPVKLPCYEHEGSEQWN